MKTVGELKKEGELSDREKKVLSFLIENARVSDSEIAQEIKITPQGVRKIRKKLERRHIVKYRTIVDYRTLGISVFAIAQVCSKNKDMLTNKHIIGAFEVNEGGVTHVLIMGFASVDEVDSFKKEIRGEAEIVKMYLLSNQYLLKNSPDGLILSYLKSDLPT